MSTVQLNWSELNRIESYGMNWSELIEVKLKWSSAIALYGIKVTSHPVFCSENRGSISTVCYIICLTSYCPALLQAKECVRLGYMCVYVCVIVCNVRMCVCLPIVSMYLCIYVSVWEHVTYVGASCDCFESLSLLSLQRTIDNCTASYLAETGPFSEQIYQLSCNIRYSIFDTNNCN